MPKNEILDNITIGIDDDSIIEAPTPYINKKPVVFYGSSITEGGCASRVGNAYNAALSRQLNMDYINFGFSGSAKGEPEMAEFIASVPMSIFVMDYDYNAPDANHLQNTHEPFFRIIREKHPDLPIVMLSNPNYRLNPEENEKRLAVIRKTYENAKARGDKNVYLISGENFYGDEDIYACTVDKIHPNDHGFALMTSEIRKTLEPILLSVIENEKEQQK
jgi:lysophospholipase L1-like esterase